MRGAVCHPAGSCASIRTGGRSVRLQPSDTFCFGFYKHRPAEYGQPSCQNRLRRGFLRYSAASYHRCEFGTDGCELALA